MRKPDEQMSNGRPIFLFNHEQMSNKVGVEHQTVKGNLKRIHSWDLSSQYLYNILSIIFIYYINIAFVYLIFDVSVCWQNVVV